MALQDLHVNLDELTELFDSTCFKIEQQFYRPFERHEETVMAIGLELSAN